MHGALSMGEVMALSFLGFLQAGLWAKLLLLKHQDRDLLLPQRYINTCICLCSCVCVSASFNCIVNMVDCTRSCTCISFVQYMYILEQLCPLHCTSFTGVARGVVPI